MGALLVSQLILAWIFLCILLEGEVLVQEPLRPVLAGELVLSLALATLAVYNLFRPPRPPRE